MKAPTWFWIAMSVWLVLGLPGFFLGQGLRGHFSLLPDPPPIFYSPHLLDQTVGTLLWLVMLPLVYMPLFAIPALLLWRRKMRKRLNAQD
jgi:hypothetical protein